MKVEDLRIGMKVRQHGRKQVFEVVGLYKGGDVICDFEENDGDVWEFTAEELEKVK